MEHENKIEFQMQVLSPDKEDLSQECLVYMKTKEFYSNRIHEQQKEIESLKQSLLYFSGKVIETRDTSMRNKMEHESEGLVTSILLEDEDIQVTGFETISKNEEGLLDTNTNLTGLKEENLKLRFQNESLREQLNQMTSRNDKLKSDKFILFTELNELLMSLRRINIDDLQMFYRMKTSPLALAKNEVPIARGVKYNLLSAQSQLLKMLKSDSKLVDLVVDESERYVIEQNVKMLQSIETEFEMMLDRKMIERNKKEMLK